MACSSSSQSFFCFLSFPYNTWRQTTLVKRSLAPISKRFFHSFSCHLALNKRRALDKLHLFLLKAKPTSSCLRHCSWITSHLGATMRCANLTNALSHICSTFILPNNLYLEIISRIRCSNCQSLFIIPLSLLLLWLNFLIKIWRPHRFNSLLEFTNFLFDNFIYWLFSDNWSLWWLFLWTHFSQLLLNLVERVNTIQINVHQMVLSHLSILKEVLKFLHFLFYNDFVYVVFILLWLFLNWATRSSTLLFFPPRNSF